MLQHLARPVIETAPLPSQHYVLLPDWSATWPNQAQLTGRAAVSGCIQQPQQGLYISWRTLNRQCSVTVLCGGSGTRGQEPGVRAMFQQPRPRARGHGPEASVLVPGAKARGRGPGPRPVPGPGGKGVRSQVPGSRCQVARRVPGGRLHGARFPAGARWLRAGGTAGARWKVPGCRWCPMPS